MRVLHLLSSLEIGGKERAVLRLSERGTRAGQQHSLFVFDAPFRGEPPDLSPGDLPWVHHPRRPGIDLRLARAIAAEARRARVDVLHAHNDTAAIYGALARPFGRGWPRKLVATLHTRPTQPGPGARLQSRLAWRLADELTAVSQELCDWVVASRLARRCVPVVNGVDLAAFAPRRPAVLREQVRFVAVARLDPIKRHVDLLEAFAAVRQRLPSATLTVVGAGPLEDALRTAAARSGSAVVFTGAIVDVAALLRDSDVFVQCSDHEGTPLALLEAMACALPVVCTDVGGMSGMVGDEDDPDRCGVLVPPRAPARLADAMLALAEAGPVVRGRLGDSARRRAARYDVEREWAAYDAIYRAPPGAPRGGR